MKRITLATLFLAALFLAHPAYAITTHNCTGLTGGTSRDLDYLSVDDLSDGDRALVLDRIGTTDHWVAFEYDATGTTSEQTSSHPFYVRPDDYSSEGVWVEHLPTASAGILNVDSYGGLISAVTAVGSSNAHLIIDSEQDLSGNSVSCHSGIVLDFRGDGGVTGYGSGTTLAAYGTVEAGSRQIFNGEVDIVTGQNQNFTNVKWFGAAGDGSTDDTDAINAASTATMSGGKINFPATSSYYRTTDTVYIDSGKDINMEGDLGLDDATHSITAMEIGDDSTVNSATMLLNVKKTAQSDWTSESSIGVKLINPNSADIQIDKANRFTIGAQITGVSRGAAYNRFNLGSLLANKINLHIYAGEGGHCNENVWYGGRFGTYSGVNSGLSRWGVLIDSSSNAFGSDYYYSNNNVFIKPSFEMRNTDASPGEAIGIELRYADYTTVLYGRAEGNTYDEKSANESAYNRVQWGYGGVSNYNTGDYPITNASIRGRSYVELPYKYTSPNLGGLSCYHDGDDEVHTRGHFWARHAGLNHYTARSGGAVYENSLTFSTNTPAFALDTHEGKSFKIIGHVDIDGDGGRVGIRCFDANGDELSGATAISSEPGSSPSYNATWNGFVLGADAEILQFSLHEDVKSIDVLFTHIWTKLMSYSVQSDEPIAFINRLGSQNSAENLATTSPTRGAWWQGKRIYNIDAVSGTTMGYVCIDRVDTEIRVAASSTDTTIECDDTTGMSAGDICGIELDSGNWHWTTVASVTDGNTFVIDDGLTDDAAVDNDIITNEWADMNTLP